MFNDYLFFNIPIKLNYCFFFFNKFLNLISLKFFYNNNYFFLFFNKIKFFFYSFNLFFFKKIKFRGKGYYIYKNKRNTIALQFGYSHIKRLYFFFVNVKFLSKTSIILFGINYKNIFLTSKKLFLIKPLNIFTGKGMRFTRQIVYKKTGKISSYR